MTDWTGVYESDESCQTQRKEFKGVLKRANDISQGGRKLNKLKVVYCLICLKALPSSPLGFSTFMSSSHMVQRQTVSNCLKFLYLCLTACLRYKLVTYN